MNTMDNLLASIENLKKSKIKHLIKKRMKEFQQNGKKPPNEIFKELCFCILTANFNAERTIKIQQKIGDKFLTLPKHKLAKKLKTFGHRFPNARAKYITKARCYKDSLKSIIQSFNNETELREWLAKNVTGIGYKEASHFLRNIGCTNLAILDFHVINILTKHGIINKPNTLTRTKYIEIEDTLKKIAKKLNLTLGELDLYLWYMETGKILK
jgi:N-glycosylase/DNA lyase